MLFDNKANDIGALLIARHHTLAVAESVTSGFIQSLLSTAIEAMLFFQGGITAYNIHQKVHLLNIDPVEATRTNCVSESIVVQMSRGAQEVFKSDYGLAISGYAAPLPEQAIFEPFAWIAATRHNHVLFTHLLTSGKKDAAAVQIDFAEQAIARLAVALKDDQAPTI